MKKLCHYLSEYMGVLVLAAALLTLAIPKSTHKERMQQNFDIFDFSLTVDEMAQIAIMNQHDEGTINFGDPQFVKYLIQNYG